MQATAVTEVILVNERDEPVGSLEKMAAHRQALLHRAFSVFLFNAAGDMLLQQRAYTKYHSGGLWTNACCSHPYPGEDTLQAANRRLYEELGIIAPLRKAFDFTYRAEFDNGLTEHEYDHVFVGKYEGEISPDPAEVHEYRYLSMREIRSAMIGNGERFTAWFHIALPLLDKWLAEHKL